MSPFFLMDCASPSHAFAVAPSLRSDLAGAVRRSHRNVVCAPFAEPYKIPRGPLGMLTGDFGLERLPDPEDTVRLEAALSAGIDPANELSAVLAAIGSACEEYGLDFDPGKIRSSKAPAQPGSIPGALGRVLSIRVHGVPAGFDVDGEELLSLLKISISERIDAIVSDHGEQPILVAFQSSDSGLDVIIEKEVSDYGLRELLVSPPELNASEETSFIPSLHVEIDGAFVDSPNESRFDTSSILVFDSLVGDDLRQRLLDLVHGNSNGATTTDWDDIQNGPDPGRWVRGGLLDVPDGPNEHHRAKDDDVSCWGLKDEAVMDICFNDHPAILSFEAKLVQLFPDFDFARLPEAVLGACVSPLTANAPTAGDRFEYHIDADPVQVPPSPWADVFGRYPNRSEGKPRFVSCLLYLNEEWDGESWGAATNFIDPPTQEVYQVLPQPGRCVIMDQDIMHTVVAPNAAAGRRPRYSLVWKLILFPKTAVQGMTDLACGKKELWPAPILIGSARQ